MFSSNCFFFNDTATTEIYTYDTLFPYTTLFRSAHRGDGVGIVDHHHPCAMRAQDLEAGRAKRAAQAVADRVGNEIRSEEHTSELQSLMRTSYAVFCL